MVLLYHSVEDRLIWHYSNNGIYNVKWVGRNFGRLKFLRKSGLLYGDCVGDFLPTRVQFTYRHIRVPI